MAVAVPLAALAVIGTGQVEHATISPLDAIALAPGQHGNYGAQTSLTVSPVATITWVNEFTELSDVSGIAIAHISNRTYALVDYSGSREDRGIRIINITDPAVPVQVAWIVAGIDGFGEESAKRCEERAGCHMLTVGINGSNEPSRCSCAAYLFSGEITTAEISNRTYALAITRWDNGIQIINITDTASPAPVAWIAGDLGVTGELRPIDIDIAEISNKTYALVAAVGAETVKIIDITDPARAVAWIDGQVLRPADAIGTIQVATVDISGRIYALVTPATRGYGMSIINVTDPASPVNVTRWDKGADGSAHMSRLADIVTAEISNRAYALATTGWGRDGGVHIVDITDPAVPFPAAWLKGGVDGFAEWDESYGIATIEISGRAYALVTAREYVTPYMPMIGPDGVVNKPRDPDTGVQIIDITDPTAPFPAAWLTDGVDGFTVLDEVRDIATVEISGSSYALITAKDQHGSVQIVRLTLP